MLIGYTHFLTQNQDQKPQSQLDALNGAGCKKE